MSTKPDNYLDNPPEESDFTKEEWLKLSYDMQYYHANKERRENIRERNKQYMSEIRALKDGESCRICGESANCALDWHHVEEKDKGVADLASSYYSVDKAKEEIKKCVLICANCHRKHHHGNLDISIKNLPLGIK